MLRGFLNLVFGGWGKIDAEPYLPDPKLADFSMPSSLYGVNLPSPGGDLSHLREAMFPSLRHAGCGGLLMEDPLKTRMHDSVIGMRFKYPEVVCTLCDVVIESESEIRTEEEL